MVEGADDINRSLPNLLRAIAAVALVAGTCGAAEISDDTFRITLPPEYGSAAKTTTNKDNIETTTWVSKSTSGEAVVVSVSRMPALLIGAACAKTRRASSRRG